MSSSQLVTLILVAALVTSHSLAHAAEPKRNWGPEQAIGEPDTPRAGDYPTAWASRDTDAREEWLLCEFKQPVLVTAINIYESYNPGALTRVTTFNQQGAEIELWRGKDPTAPNQPRGVSRIPVNHKTPLHNVKLYLDSAAVPGWNEIDAVGLEDAAGKSHWASAVQASTTYADPQIPAAVAPLPGPQPATLPIPPGTRPWGPEQAAGPPDTPDSGDLITAWASRTPDGQVEWLECEYVVPIAVQQVIVVETFNPGAVTSILAVDPQGKETLLWAGRDPTPAQNPRGASQFPLQKPFLTKKIKIILDSPGVQGWNEIDAVGVIGPDLQVIWADKVKASSTYADTQLMNDLRLQ